MSWIKQHWKYTLVVAPLLLCLLALKAYALYLDSQPPEVARRYVMPAGTDRVSAPQPEFEAPIAKTESIVTIDAPDQATREEMIAKRDALLAEKDALLAKRDAQIAKKDALLAENEALRAAIERERFIRASRDGTMLIGELHDWATTEFAVRADRIRPDLGRDDVLGDFAYIEANELWMEAVARVSKLDRRHQQQLIDSMRAQGYPDAADLMADDLAQLTGGAQ